MKIVKFKDGTYGVRRGWVKVEFLNLYEALECSIVKWTTYVPWHHFYKGTLSDTIKAKDWLDDYGTEMK